MKAVKVALLAYHKQFQIEAVHSKQIIKQPCLILGRWVREHKQLSNRITGRNLEVSPTA